MHAHAPLSGGRLARAAERRGRGRTILMLGPPIDGRGGMSAVAAAYRDDGLFEREQVRYVATTAEGGPLSKLAAGLRAVGTVASQLLRGRVALLHVHVASGKSFWRKALFCWLAFGAQCPVLLHVHGGNFIAFYRASPALAQRVIRATLRRAGQVAVLSPRWASRLFEVCPPGRFTVLWNPVAAWPMGPLQRDGRFCLLFLGRLEHDKGVFDLIAAFARAFGDCGEAVLQLGGEGDRDAVERHARSLGVADRVEFLGWVAGAAKRSALERADIFVLPSYVEGLPVAMLEAMHCGVPIVMSAVGSIPEVATDGVDALLVAPGDVDALACAMRRLYLDPVMRGRLARAGRQLFDAQFAMQAVGPELHRLYSTLALRL